MKPKAFKAERYAARHVSADAFRRKVFADSPAVLAFLDKESLAALFPPAKIFDTTPDHALLSNPREVPKQLWNQMRAMLKQQFPDSENSQ